MLPVSYYNTPYLPIYIQDLNCTGSESSIWDCPHNSSVQHCTSYYNDASVLCQCKHVMIPSRFNYFPTDKNTSVDLSCTTGDVRLVGGVNHNEGRVEMCYNHFWGSVCHRYWSTVDANVVCKQLGHQPTGLHINTILLFCHIIYRSYYIFI